MPCCPEFPNIRVETPGGMIDLPVVGNVITVPGLVGESIFAAVQGLGVGVVAGGPNGHEPTLSVRPSPDSPIPLSFDSAGRLRVGPADPSPIWSTPNQTPANGIRVVAGGSQGHTPEFRLWLDPSSPLDIDAQGRLTVDGLGSTCEDLVGCSISALGDVDLTGMFPGQTVTVNDIGTLIPADAGDLMAAHITEGQVLVAPSAPTSGGPYQLEFNPDLATLEWVLV